MDSENQKFASVFSDLHINNDNNNTNGLEDSNSTTERKNAYSKEPKEVVAGELSKNNFIIERIFCYETRNFYYVVGSSNCQTKFRVLKFDRRFKNNLVISDNKRAMTLEELNEYRKVEGFDVTSRIEPTVAFGIVGFVRFLEGYYLILLVKRRCVAIIGRHCIYKIEDTCMLYIPNEDRSNNVEEQRYLKIFNNVDLKSNFYFSHSYDLSNTLQYNLSPFYQCNFDQFQCGFGHPKTIWDMSEGFLAANQHIPFDDKLLYIKPNLKYVWNEYLLSPMRHVHNDFFLYICHGFVSQAILPITGRNMIITLIARRSKKYAGTRFLKRGANCEGFTANEVETEQIVADGNMASFRYGLYTSFVQLRGSVPTYWSQNIAKIAPKPPIVIDIKDPFYEAAGKHFNSLLYDYGSPVNVLNLVKRKEKKPQESILYNEFEEAIEYLNQFIPKQHQIILIGFDMARMNKMKDQNVINQLSEIALYTLKKTGFFQNHPIAINKETGFPKSPTHNNSTTVYSSKSSEPIFQTGITRVNCVDCLDRTNTAQFALGRIALAYQLYNMGVIPKPELMFDTAIVRLLEELYEDHGDTLALQYGGSQLVHRIKTYRKIAPLTSQSKDIMQSLSRYYSNAFSDADKQNAINLFLGVYQANRLMPIWNMYTDYHMHHSFAYCKQKPDLYEEKMYSSVPQSLYLRVKYTKWWSDEVALCLPRAAREFFKDSKQTPDLQQHFIKLIYDFDWFFDVHRLREANIFNDIYLYNMKKAKFASQDISTLKKLTNFRNQNRQSLVGIPLNTTSTSGDDSELSDLSDAENEQIIIRFENDCNMTNLEDVQDGTEFDFSRGQYETHHTSTSESKKQYHQNWLQLTGKQFLSPMYERRLRSMYRTMLIERNGSHTPNLSCKLYSNYLKSEQEIGAIMLGQSKQLSPDAPIIPLTKQNISSRNWLGETSLLSGLSYDPTHYQHKRNHSLNYSHSQSSNHSYCNYHSYRHYRPKYHRSTPQQQQQQNTSLPQNEYSKYFNLDL